VLLTILMLAVPLAELSPGRVRNLSVALLGLLVVADAVAVGILLAALAGSDAGSLSAGDLLAHGAVVWLTNIITSGLLSGSSTKGDRASAPNAAGPTRISSSRRTLPGDPTGVHD
jgi:hypothetical protein